MEFDDYDYDDDYPNEKPVYMKGSARNSNKISWQDVYQTIVWNTEIILNKGDGMALNTGDMQDDHLLSRAEIEILENDIQVIEVVDGTYPVFSKSPENPTYEEFIGLIQANWDKILNPPSKPDIDTSTRDEQRYFSGSEGSGGF